MQFVLWFKVSAIYLRLELVHVKTWIFSKVQIDKPNIVRRSDYKRVSRVPIKLEHVKDLTVQMATSTMVIRHRSLHRLSALRKYISVVDIVQQKNNR